MRLAIVVVCAACAGAPRAPVSAVRFADAEPAWFVDDRRPVATKPAARPDFGELRAFDVAVTNRIRRALSSTPAQRALGTNSLDEAPSSTWFVNRIGVRDVDVDEIRRGPGAGRGPDRSAPLRVTRAKHVGQIPGFIAEDAAGVRWLIKFDVDGVAAESAADVASQRLLWAIGYYVPENHPGYLERSDVVVAETATFSDVRGRKRPMTTADLDATFARAVRGPRGYRILASKLVSGTPIGAAPLEGVRADDPNDTIPHELRREWRGLYVFAAWLQHTDFKEMGTLDVWDTDPVDPSRKVVFHYLVDFGNTLGLYARHRPDDGHTEKLLDLDHLKSLASFGLWKRPWEGVRSPGIAGVGAFDVEHFDPGGFTPYAPFPAFLAADASDALWATKILLRLTPEHIRAALEAGQFEDPRAIDYLVGVLVGRQRKTARYWFDRIAPIDAPRFEHGRLCVRDLAVAHDLATAPRSYAATIYDWHGTVLGTAAAEPAHADGTVCIADLRYGAARGGYTIVRLDVTGGARRLPSVEVHIVAGPRAPRVVGIERHL